MDYELGVIGGMGPLATNVFYQYLIDHTDAHSDQEHLNVVILSHASMPDRTNAILTGEADAYLQDMRDDIHRLETLGVKAIAIPCNTSHYFYDQYAEDSKVPILHMVKETVKRCAEIGARRVAVLATQGTLSTGLYDHFLEKENLESVPIVPEDADLLMKIIYSVKAENRRVYPELTEMIDRYAKEATVVLACTELSTIEVGDRPVVDALKVLGNVAIRKCRGHVKF